MILARLRIVISCVVLGLCLAASAAPGGETVHGLVEAGKRLFAAGKFDQAQEKFAAAEVQAPENPVIAYNRALTYQAAGNVAKAEDYYRKAEFSRDTDLNVRTTFNLGTLRILKARALLGEDPVKVGTEDREAILDHLEAAVARFRTVLETRPKDTDARYNIEVIRLWVKDMTDRWRKADREKARSEADLVKYLEYLMNAQEVLEDETEALQEGENAPSGRPVRLEQVIRVQEELGDEIPHLKDKVKAFIQKMAEKTAAPGAPGAATPRADPKQLEKLNQAEAQLTALADRAGKAMDEAVQALGDLALGRAATSQSTAHDRLLDMWKGLADFMAVLARAIRGQDAVIAGTEPFCEEVGEEETQEEVKAREIEAAQGLKKDQVEVRDLVPLLTARAQGMKSQLQKAPAPKPGGQPPGQPSPQEIVKALDKALELLPDADAAMKAAVRAVGDRSWKTGLEEEKKAADILSKIRDLFKNKKDQKKDEQKKQDQKKNDSKKKDEQKKDDAKKPPRDPRKMTPEEAERQLQKMREKRKKRDKKRHAEAAARRPRVEKDW